MRRYRFLHRMVVPSVLLFLTSLPAYAIDLPEVSLRVSLGFNTEDLIARNWRLPKGCRKESLSVDEDPVRGLECERVICGGHFWGESAIDLCCADVAEGETFRLCQRRYPVSPSATGGWREIRFPREISHPVTCGNYLVPLEELSATSGLTDFFLPDLYAHPSGAPSIPWSYAETLILSNTAAVVSDLIEIALMAGDPNEVGAPDSQFRRWVGETWVASQFLAHVLSPIGVPACPPTLIGLCEFISDQVEGNWADLAGFWGETHHLDSLVLARELALDISPGLLAIVMETAIHETTHIIFHWTHGLFEGPYSSGFDYNFIMSPDPVVNYDDEMSASMIGVIAFHFFPPGVRELIPENLRYVEGYYEDIFARLVIEEGQNLAETHPESYVNTFFWESLSQEQRDRIRGCVDFMYRYSSVSRTDQEIFSKVLVFCIGEELGETEAMALLRELNDRLLGRGGSNGPGAADQGGTLPLSHHPDLHHDYVESPETETGPGGSTEGDPPDEDFDWDHPGNFTEDPNDPDYEPPNTSNHIPTECLPTFGAPETAGPGTPAACFDWCWSHFSRGRDMGGICQQLTNRDVDANCQYSSGDACETEIEQRIDDCNSSPTFRNNHLEFCRDACGSSGTLAHCDDLCAGNRSLAFCDNICEREHTYGFCGDICHQDDHSHGFCRERCEDDPGRPYCDNICSSNRTYSFCDDTCARDRSYGYCDDLCVSNTGLSFCDELCSDNHSYGFCDEVCRRNSSYSFCDSLCAAQPNLDFCRAATCDAGLASHASVTLWIERGGCFPYVGPAECCGSVSASNCTPTGTNQACDHGGICGCYTNGAENWLCCDPPGSAFGPGYHSSVYTGDDCIIASWYVPATCGCAIWYVNNYPLGTNTALENYIVNICPCFTGSPYCNP